MNGESRPPEIWGYRVTTSLGRGGNGSVWRAVDRSGRDVAIKVADRARRVPERTVAEMFRREALVALNLRHPNLVRGLETGTTVDGRTFLAMELVVGETLRERVRSRGPIAEKALVALGIALASALEHAHSMGLLHRDVKPDNVMLLADGGVKLVDLGLVVERGRGEHGCGSPGFVSPEMIRRKEVGPRSDLYSLGATLAFAALGHPPFVGDDAKAVLRASLSVPLELPERVGDARFSEDFRAVVARLGRKDPEERYGSAGELRLDLEAIAGGERPLGAWLALARRRAPRGRVLALGIGAGILALATTAILLPWRRGAPAVPDIPPSPPSSPGEAPEPDDPRVEAALLYVEAHPDDFARGRALVGEALAAATSGSQRTRTRKAAAALEARFSAAAAARLARQRESALALAEAGDLDGVDRILTDWPPPFEAAPERARASALASSLRNDALAPGAALLAEGRASLPAWEAGAVEAFEEAGRFLERLDRFRGESRRPREQRAEVDALRERVVSAVGRLAGVRAERAAERTLVTYFERSAAGDPAGARAALESLGAQSSGGHASARRAAAVVAHGRDVENALARRLARLVGAEWAGVVESRLFVGTVRAAPSPRGVFLPSPSLLAGTDLARDAGDLLDAEPDREGVACWLLLEGEPEMAATLASADGPAAWLSRQRTGGARSATVSVGGVWEELPSRVALTLRDPGALPAAVPEGLDGVFGAWVEAIRAPGRAPVPRASAPASGEAAAARAAFFREEWVAAWTALDRAVHVAPRDPELAVLRCRVLDLLAAPLRTRAASMLALSEARRARDLDPSLPAACRLFAEQAVLFRERHPGALADALLPAARAAAEEAVRIDQADAHTLAFLGELRLDASKPREAAVHLRRASREAPDDGRIALLLARAEEALGDTVRAREALARARERLGPAFPPWARALWDRLSGR